MAWRTEIVERITRQQYDLMQLQGNWQFLRSQIHIVPRDRFNLEDREEYLVTMKRRFLRVDGPLRSWNTNVQEEGNGACVMLRTLSWTCSVALLYPSSWAYNSESICGVAGRVTISWKWDPLWLGSETIQLSCWLWPPERARSPCNFVTEQKSDVSRVAATIRWNEVPEMLPTFSPS